MDIRRILLGSLFKAPINTLVAGGGPVRRKDTERLVTNWLERNEWELRPLRGLLHYADILARNAAVTIAIRCSGYDSRLLFTSIKDLRSQVRELAYHPVFVYGEEKDYSILQHIRPDKDSAISVYDLDQIPNKLKSLPPVFVGAIYKILPDSIVGWIRVSPQGYANIIAYYKDDVVGSMLISTTENNRASRNDERIVFELKINKKFSDDEILGQVSVKVIVDDAYIGRLFYKVIK